MPNNPLRRYELLDSFRGFAILLVVCFHIMAGVGESYGVLINKLINTGYLGVSIFCVRVVSDSDFSEGFFC